MNKHNNVSDNLEWVTSVGNKKHARDNGITNSGTNNGMSELNNEDIFKIRESYKKGTRWNKGISYKKLAEEFVEATKSFRFEDMNTSSNDKGNACEGGICELRSN